MMWAVSQYTAAMTPAKSTTGTFKCRYALHSSCKIKFPSSSSSSSSLSLFLSQSVSLSVCLSVCLPLSPLSILPPPLPHLSLLFPSPQPRTDVSLFENQRLPRLRVAITQIYYLIQCYKELCSGLSSLLSTEAEEDW